MNRKGIINTDLLSTGLRSDLENAKRQIKGIMLETELMLNRELEKRERIRYGLAKEKSIKKIELNNTRFLGKDTYPFVTLDEKSNLFDMLNRAKEWGNKEYRQQQKKIILEHEKLDMVNENIKSMKNDLKELEKYMSSIVGRLRKLK